jgi:predicted DNA-binding protein
MTPRGNPDFGTKYRFDYGRDEPLSEQVKVLMHSKMKSQLKNLAAQNKCTVPDVIREAIDKYLDGLKTEDAS